MAKLKLKTQVVTNAVRLSYVNLFEPGAPDSMNPGKYTVSLIISKNDKDSLSVIKQAVKNCYEEHKGDTLKGVDFSKCQNVLHDGDQEKPSDTAYANSYYLSAKANKKPNMYNIDGTMITDPNDLYSGCWGKAIVTFYAYNKGANKGIACAIDGVKKVKDDEPLSGSVVQASDFDDDDNLTDWEDI